MVTLKILKALLGLFPTLQLDIPSIEPVGEVLNIFAWARAFLPVTLFLALLALSLTYYTFKVLFALVKYVISVIL